MTFSIPPSLALAGFIAVFGYFLWTKVQSHLKHSRFIRENGCEPPPKYPHRDPIFGLDTFFENMRNLKSRTFLAGAWARYQAMGRTTYQSIMLGTNVINTVHPTNVKAILSSKFEDFDIGPKRREAMSHLLGNGIFMVDGPKWEKLRALMRPNFVKRLFTDLEELEVHVGHLIERIPRDGRTFDLQVLLFSLVLDTATALFFGQSVHSLVPGASPSAERFVEAFNRVVPLITQRVRLGFLASLLPDPKMASQCQILRGFIKENIRNARERERLDAKGEFRSDGKPKRSVFLNALLQDCEDEEEICDYLINILLGARDTTAGLLSDLFFILARRPDVLAKLQAEVAQLNGEKPTMETLAKMKYLRNTILETLRLYPVIPTNQRIANKDTFLPCGGGLDGTSPVFVKKDQPVTYHVYSMHRSKETFGEDSEEFKPERFENPPPAWSFLPFNGGPRICLGQQLAMTEASYTTTRLLQEFANIESRDGNRPWQEGLTITCAVGGGVKVAVTPAKA
ncbi:MAG: hypothetical protein M1837_000262 [Sclerophora amabilis]|nr:MAG: hypothetical protein M1837_000262 [Sclerophora amabilis]